MNYSSAQQSLLRDYAEKHAIHLAFAGCNIRVASNDATLIGELSNYFARYVATDEHPVIELVLNETEVIPPPVPLTEWPRPEGKRGKEAYADLLDARLIEKRRTGLLFLQGVDKGVVAGPLRRNINQVVNFINNQTISHWKRDGWEICHAAALAGPGGLVAFGGLSGGGKSTLMLHLMNAGPYSFISNDRLLIRRINGEVLARGVAKMPRVNPGTLLNNPALTQVLPEDRRNALNGLSNDELWTLEEKYDAPMAEIFGEHRIAEEGPLKALVILTWERESRDAPELHPCSLERADRALQAIMKGPGPFHADSMGHFVGAEAVVPAAPYLQTLGDLPAFQLRGGVDFGSAVRLCQPLLDL